MKEVIETLRTYVRQHPELSPLEIKGVISRQLKGEIFPGEIDEVYEAVK